MSKIPASFRVALEPLVASARRLDASAQHAWLREMAKDAPVVALAIRAILDEHTDGAEAATPRVSRVSGLWRAVRERVSAAMPAPVEITVRDPAATPHR